MKRLLEEFALISARWIRELSQGTGVAHPRVRAFFIITAILTFPLQASSASTAASLPLPPPRPAEAPSHPAPNDLAPAEQTKREPTIDQACLDRLGAAGIEFELVTLPPAVNPECAIATPVRLKAVKLPPPWRTSIRLPEEPTLSCQFGERFGHWLRDLVAPLIAGGLAVELKSVHTGQGYECRNRNRAECLSALWIGNYGSFGGCFTMRARVVCGIDTKGVYQKQNLRLSLLAHVLHAFWHF
jgi:Extensin-like protein C-terminus